MLTKLRLIYKLYIFFIIQDVMKEKGLAGDISFNRSDTIYIFGSDLVWRIQLMIIKG